MLVILGRGGRLIVSISYAWVDGVDADARIGLLEAKGIHHTPGVAPPSDADEKNTGAPSEGKEGKPSLKEKIKAKLHKN
jgi:hypothetical protein